MRSDAVLGFLFIILSAAFFAIAAPVAKLLYGIGWSPGMVISARLCGAALLLLPATLHALRGRWHLVSLHWKYLLAYGLLSMAGLQAFFFVALEYLAVTVALLLEMTAPLMIVFWVWARSGHRPSTVTFIGMLVAMAGLVFVLNPGAAPVSVFGVVMALAAAVCLAGYFLISADRGLGLPPFGLTGLGMIIGAATTVLLNLMNLLPARVSWTTVELAGHQVSWAVPLLLSIVLTVTAYLLGIMGLRYIGPTVGSFLNLVEVPFTALAAWLFLAEAITGGQMLGGALILAGVVFMKWGDLRRERRIALRDALPAAVSAMPQA